MKLNSDIDIDFADRDAILKIVDVTSASIRKDNVVKKHNTGVYPTDIPYDPIHKTAALDYEMAEQRGYIKLDLLNVWIYKYVKDEQHLVELMKEPDWSLLQNRDYFSKLIHIGNHYDSMLKMPESINSITRMAMFLAVIRPGKRNLIGKSWAEVAKTVWDKNKDDGYMFKKAHAVAYSNLIVVNMNLLTENAIAFSSQE
jgi:hypothetical protein